MVKVGAEVIGEEDLPELDRVVERELAFEGRQEPPETEKQVERASRLCGGGRSARLFRLFTTRCSRLTKVVVQASVHDPE